MKIGDFSKNNNISIDTVRHYIDIGLLNPFKKNSFFDFGLECQNDIEEILLLKKMGFSLSEIKSIKIFKKLAKLMPYEEKNYFKKIFNKKKIELEEEIKILNNYKKNLLLKLDSINKENIYKKNTLGIDLSLLQLFACPVCNNENLVLNAKLVENNQVIDGSLKCSCGNSINIKSGIIISKEIIFENYNILKNINDYFDSTDISYLEKISKGISWVSKKFNEYDLKNHIILELGSGSGFFLRNIFDLLNTNNTYIAIDRDYNKHLYLKKIIENSNLKCKFIFICCDFLDIPLKKNSVDSIIDSATGSIYGFDHKEFLLEASTKYAKEKSQILASYFIFEKFSSNSFIKEEFREIFNKNILKNKINNLGYTIIDDYSSDYIEKGGKYEDYFKEGEKHYSYYFIASK